MTGGTLRRAGLGLASTLAALALAWLAWDWLRPIPDPREIAALARAGAFAEAEALARRRVRIDPVDPGSRLLLAQLLVEPASAEAPGSGRDPGLEEPRLLEALETLEAARFADRRMAAEAALWRGKALFGLRRYDAAERAWVEAIGLDPTVPEAGWGLLEMYYLQGRPHAARTLALRLFETEPDPRDRAQLLLELVRQDAQPTAPGSLVPYFEPAVARNPGEVRAGLALGLALVRDARVDEGIARLRRSVDEHPGDPDAWAALLAGLDDGGRVDDLAGTLDRLPEGLAADPRFAEARGRAAQEARDWSAAAEHYRRALEARPHEPRLEFRLARVLRQAGEAGPADELDRCHARHLEADRGVRDLYDEADAVPTLGVGPHDDLYRRLAENRDAMGRPAEADAWRSLIRPRR